MLKTINLAEFKSGIDMLSDETSIPKGSCRDAVNVDFDVYGNFRSRAGFEQLSSMVDAHSLWGSASGDFGLLAQADKLRRVVVQDGTVLTAVVLSGLTLSTSMSYYEHANEVFFSNGAQLGVISTAGARLLGADVPTAPALQAATAGALPAGKYSVACSVVAATGEESGLSELTSIELAGQGGIQVIAHPAPGAKIRVYRTPTNGDVLYLAAELPEGTFTYLAADERLGKQADTQHLAKMPAGGIIRAYNGRLVVARGAALIFSQPFRYGLTSPRHDFVQFNSLVTMVEPVATGIYVGVEAGPVYFLSGGGPSDFEQRLVSLTPAVPGSSSLVRPSVFEEKLAKQAASPAALWLSQGGYVAGLADGSVHDLQADRISLPAYAQGTPFVATLRGVKQALSIVESRETAGLGLAVDSEI